jgi:AcrR family transcriptional regulator
MASAATGPAKPRDARQVKSDAALRAALLALITRMPFDKITVRDIVAEAGIGYATFFRHYPSKDALLDAVAGEEIAAMMALTAPLLSPTDTRSSCVVLAQHVAANRDVWTALLTGGAAGHLREQFVRLAAQVPGPDQGSEWLPSDLGLIFGVSATVEILAWWLRQKPDYPVDDVAELLDRLVIRPTGGSLKRN